MAHGKLKSVRTTEEARELGRKGGIASGKARRQKRTIKENLLVLRDMPMTPERCRAMGMEEGSSYGEGWAMALGNGALEGNPQLARLAMELLGESKQELNINGAMPVVIHDDIK